MKEVTVTEFARGLSEFINRATYRREEFLITRGGKPVAALSPAPSGVRVSDLSETLSSLPKLDGEDIAAFESDLSTDRDENNSPVIDPWE
jgi:antitoxin (DNA-binding transcriptional repressor) of toxin-antitoxin stability system